MRRSLAFFATAALVVACGGGGGELIAALMPHIATTTPIQGVGVGSNFSFDIGAVNGNRYYLADRSNAALDVFDTATSQQLAQIKGTGANAFAGQAVTSTGAADNAHSGPNGVNIVGNLVYVGDVDSVKIIDPAALT